MAEKEIKRLILIRNEENPSFSNIEIMGEEQFKKIRQFGDSYKLRPWCTYFMILVFSVN